MSKPHSIKTESPDYQICSDSPGFLLLQRYIFCRVLDIRVSQAVIVKCKMHFMVNNPAAILK